ncbi:MAG: ABC transporter permease [Ruminiclostridium sp.]|nr:ABC transporter permease [Ruminiclostridium sp.]
MNLREIFTIAYYDLKIFFRYKINILWLVVTPTVYYLIGAVLINIMGTERFLDTTGGSDSGSLYVLIGYAVFSLANFCWQSGRRIETEMIMGTTKTNFLLPIKRSSYVYGLSLSVILSTGLITLLQFFIIAAIVKASLQNIVTAFFLLMLSTVYFLGVSLVVSSVSLVYKRVGDLSNILTFILQVITGLMIPIRSLPKIMQYICFFSPTTWAIDCVRCSLLNLSPILPLWIEASILIVAALTVHIIGQFLLGCAEKKMQRDGLLETY